MKDLSIIIVSFNTKKLLEDCIKSVKLYTGGVDYEIIVVDNGSKDDSPEFLKRESDIKTIFNKSNLGFAAANNQGIKKATGRYVLLLNSDTELKENSFAKMVRFMDEHPKVGIATCKLLNPDGSIQATGGSFPTLARLFLWATFLDDLPFVANLFGSYHPHTPRFFGKSDFYTQSSFAYTQSSFAYTQSSSAYTQSSPAYKKEHSQDWVTGAFFLFRRELVDKIGYLDEEFFMYVEEVDYCFRAKKLGWEVWYVPQTAIVHIGGASDGSQGVFFGEGLARESSILGELKGLRRFYRKHYSLWHYPFLVLFLKLAAFLRIFVFGILGRQGQAWRIYGKALAIG